MAVSGDTGRQLATLMGNGVAGEIVTILNGTATGNITVPSGSNLTLTQGNVTLTSGNVTLTSGNLNVTAGNGTYTSGNLTLSSGNLLLSSGNITLTSGSLIRTLTHQIGGGQVKVGTTAGWVVGAANNLGTIATLPQSQTNSTLVLRVQGLPVGATITAINAYASGNSAGNTATINANLRKIIIAAGATGTDSSIDTTNTASITSATATTITKTGLTETVVAGSDYYILFTATTAASTTWELTGAEITYTSV